MDNNRWSRGGSRSSGYDNSTGGYSGGYSGSIASDSGSYSSGYTGSSGTGSSMNAGYSSRNQNNNSAYDYGHGSTAVPVQPRTLPDRGPSYSQPMKQEPSSESLIETKIAQALEKMVSGNQQNRSGMMGNPMNMGMSGMMGMGGSMMGGGPMMGSMGGPGLMGAGPPSLMSPPRNSPMKRPWSSNQTDPKRQRMSNSSNRQQGNNRRSGGGSMSYQNQNNKNRAPPNVTGLDAKAVEAKYANAKYCKFCKSYYTEHSFMFHKKTSDHEQAMRRHRRGLRSDDSTKNQDTSKDSTSVNAKSKRNNSRAKKCAMCDCTFEEDTFEEHKATNLAHIEKYAEVYNELEKKRKDDKPVYDILLKKAKEEKLPLETYKLCEVCECTYQGPFQPHRQSMVHRRLLRLKTTKEEKEKKGEVKELICKYGCEKVEQEHLDDHWMSEGHKAQVKTRKENAEKEKAEQKKKEEKKTPPGMDQVVQVKGYYCRACLKFYTDEKMAKFIHCASKEHVKNLEKKNLLKVHERVWLDKEEDEKIKVEIKKEAENTDETEDAEEEGEKEGEQEGEDGEKDEDGETNGQETIGQEPELREEDIDPAREPSYEGDVNEDDGIECDDVQDGNAEED